MEGLRLDFLLSWCHSPTYVFLLKSFKCDGLLDWGFWCRYGTDSQWYHSVFCSGSSGRDGGERKFWRLGDYWGTIRSRFNEKEIRSSIMQMGFLMLHEAN